MDLPTRARTCSPSRPVRSCSRALSELRRPAGTEELAERLELHPNGVRVHLERLREAGLVRASAPRQARAAAGHVGDRVRTRGPAASRPRAYADLGRWLARLDLAGQDQSARGRGERDARSVASSRPTGRRSVGRGEDARRARRRWASSPSARSIAAGGLTYGCATAPTATPCARTSDVVCTLHRGITRGLLDEHRPGDELDRLRPARPVHRRLPDRAYAGVRRRSRRAGRSGGRVRRTVVTTQPPARLVASSRPRVMPRCKGTHDRLVLAHGVAAGAVAQAER